MTRRLLGAAALALAAAITACGGSDDDTAATATSRAATDGPVPLETGSSSALEEDAERLTDGTDPQDASDDASEAGDGEGSAEARCADLLASEEVEALFGEPALLDPALSQAEPDLGALLCSWATVEGDDPGDSSSQGLSLNVYSGDPVAGVNFYDPTRETDPEPIEDLGDEAFLAHTTGIDTGVLDGERATLLSYYVVDLGDGALEERVTDAEVVELLRTVHARAVG